MMTLPGKRLLSMVKVQCWDEPSASQVGCDWGPAQTCPRYAFLERYHYDSQGRRIAKVHRADAAKSIGRDNGNSDEFGMCGPDKQLSCIEYDYDGANVLVERRAPEPPVCAGLTKDRYMSTYTHGPLGLVSRVAQEENSCAEDDCVQYYLNDATGSCVGTVCGSSNGTCSSQPVGGAVSWTRMDAWGNLIAPIFYPGAAAAPGRSLPTAVLDCSPSSQPCAATQPATLDKAQVIAGPYQYHGSQGYECDLVDPRRGAVPPDEGQTEPEMGRSTGFMHVGCRYYEPATGRFLEYDPLPADPTPVAWGQHNRWVYCANDPVNFIDSNGQWIQIVVYAVLIIGGAVIGYYLGGPIGAVVGAVTGGLIAYLGAAAFAESLLGGTGAGATVTIGGMTLASINGVQNLGNSLTYAGQSFCVTASRIVDAGAGKMIEYVTTGKNGQNVFFYFSLTSRNWFVGVMR